MITDSPPRPLTDAGIAAANKDGLATVPSLRTLGTGGQQACSGNDARLSNARLPLAHTHPTSDIVGLLPSRELLTAARTYFVATTGNNANNGLSAGAPFATIQKAVDVASALDNGGFAVSISVAAGTYTGSVTLRSYVGSGTISITGAGSTTVLSVTGATAVTAADVGIWALASVKISTVTVGYAIAAQGITTLNVSGVEFAAVPTGYSHISAIYGAFVQLLANYTISGGASNHWDAEYGGRIGAVSLTITLTGTPAFIGQFALAYVTGVINCPYNTFSGSATGTRYFAGGNGVINTGGGGANYLPGNVAGSWGSGGQYL